MKELLLKSEVATDPERSGPGYPLFFADPERIRIQFFSKKRIRIGSESEFVSAPGNNLETKSALHFAETLGIHLKLAKKRSNFERSPFFVSLFLLWSSREIGKNAQSNRRVARNSQWGAV